ncbi:sensor histidine kinase [Bacillus sp. PS06]|uniref:sensor histidine kinase n=1 Tax=Bacillus sp. PS06 TaxID=2764176 RepID=UPI00177B9C91|nr:sensor histidine kinase [Bacillus sp. PS06]MBD8071145.1 sensor histidine kinase [Bacillus sp. PS06]
MVTIFKNLNIKNKIFSISLLLLFIFSSIGLFAYDSFINLYEKRIFEESEDMLQLSSSVLDKEFKKIEQLTFQIGTEDTIQNSLTKINANDMDFLEYQAKSRLLTQLLGHATSEPYIASVQVLDNLGGNYKLGFDTTIETDLKKLAEIAQAAEGLSIWTQAEENHLVVARVIREKVNVSLAKLGLLIVTIDVSKLLNETLDFSPTKNFVITNNDEIIYKTTDLPFREDLISTKNDNGYNKVVMDDKEFLVSYKHSSYSDLVYYNILPYDNITQQSTEIKQIIFALFILMLALTLILSRFAAKGISKPIEQLTEKMRLVQQGDFENNHQLEGRYYNDEIGILHHDFQVMLEKIKSLISENYTKQLVIKEAEYKALQSQINPHFLYNTLDSINWLARSRKQHEISGLAEALGNMMRKIISKKEPMISIKEELEIVQSYITIQKFRYGDRIHFTLDTHEDYEKIKIPKLTIQPMIENAIQHGLEEIIGECHISVKLEAIEDELIIFIEDNGPGMEESKVKAILSGEVVSKKSSGIGLNNIRERIRLMFGEEYGIQIESVVSKGTKVIITLPNMME